MGLSTQVPSKIIYLTDGPNSEVSIGRRSIQFKHARPKALAGLEGKIAPVVHALRHPRRDRVGTREIETLRGALTPVEKCKLVKGTRFGVDWILRRRQPNWGDKSLNSIARMPANARAELFTEAADRKALSEAIIEKDFWVCWVLQQLFSIEALKGRLIFKDETSLSKILHVTPRRHAEFITPI